MMKSNLTLGPLLVERWCENGASFNLEETKSDVKRFLALYKVNSVEEMTVANYVDASRLLDRKKREMEGENGAN